MIIIRSIPLNAVIKNHIYNSINISFKYYNKSILIYSVSFIILCISFLWNKRTRWERMITWNQIYQYKIEYICILLSSVREGLRGKQTFELSGIEWGSVSHKTGKDMMEVLCGRERRWVWQGRALCLRLWPCSSAWLHQQNCEYVNFNQGCDLANGLANQEKVYALRRQQWSSWKLSKLRTMNIETVEGNT